MSEPLENYAMLGDLRTAALVSRTGSIDWLCLPNFDSPSVFTNLLGTVDDGRWLLHVIDGEVTSWRYLPNTFILETTWTTQTGELVVYDFLPTDDSRADVVRYIKCTRGTVRAEHILRMRFDYGRVVPWTRAVTHRDDEYDSTHAAILAIAGPDALVLHGPALAAHPSSEPANDPHIVDDAGAPYSELAGHFDLTKGDELGWSLTWFASHDEPPGPVDAPEAFDRTVAYWHRWTNRFDADLTADPLVARSLLVLRALTHAETGGIVAAATTSLPEDFGGERNWDYRYTWLRDASLTIDALIAHGFTTGATKWRDWLLRAIAGDPHNVQIMYGIDGRRDLPERTLDSLEGYENSRPVRIGNGAVDQYQADVTGEVMLALRQLRDAGVPDDEYSWALQVSLLKFCEDNFDRKDHGIWEVRGEPQFFTHGRVMMWAAFDCGVAAVEQHGLPGPVDRWRERRDTLRDEIMTHGFNDELGSFTQHYDTTNVDAALLQIPQTGFLPWTHPYVLGTVDAIERELQDEHGLLRRYRTETGVDGLAGDEGAFLVCVGWLIEQYANSNRLLDAEKLLDQIASYANELGLLAEEYDVERARLAGNFPQAFSHLGFVKAALAVGKQREREAQVTADFAVAVDSAIVDVPVRFE